MDYHHPVWSTKDTSTTINDGQKRFQGEHDIPFEFSFPSTVDLSILIPASFKSKARESMYSDVLTFPTPQTTHHGHTMSLQYELVVLIEHGFFSPSTKYVTIMQFTRVLDDVRYQIEVPCYFCSGDNTVARVTTSRAGIPTQLGTTVHSRTAC